MAYTEQQKQAALEAESIYNVIAYLPPDEGDTQYNENLADSVEIAGAVARRLLVEAGLDPDNTPTGIFL